MVVTCYRKNLKRRLAMDQLIDVFELAKALKVKPGTIRTWTRDKKIPNYKLAGKIVRFNLSEVLSWMADQHRKEVV